MILLSTNLNVEINLFFITSRHLANVIILYIYNTSEPVKIVGDQTDVMKCYENFIRDDVTR